MANGGKRPGAGRPKGAKSYTTYRKERRLARVLRAADATSDRTMLELVRIAFADRRGIVLKPLPDWTADEGALLEGFETIVKNAAGGDGHTDTVHKVHLAKKLGALEILAKHFGIAVERVEVSGQLDLVNRLVAARKRSASEPS